MQGVNKVIGIDARFLLRPLRGMPTYVYMLCKHLPLQFPDTNFVFFINKGFEHNDFEENYQPRIIEVSRSPNVKLVNINDSGEIRWEQVYLPKALEAHNVDLLHMPGNRVCFFTKVKQVATFHDVMEWKYLKLFNNYGHCSSLREKQYVFRKRVYSWLTYKFGLRFADHILTISQYSQQSICDVFTHTKSKTSYVYHGVPAGFASSDKLLGHDERSGVLMLGGDSVQKNPENMIRAWFALPEGVRKNHKLTIAGFTGGENSPISNTIKALGCENEVIVLGWITEAELVDLMSTCRVFLFASKEEGFGFPLIQAMSMGLPVVTSQADVLVEIGGEAVLSAPADSPKRLSECLTNLLVDNNAWEQSQLLGLQRAKMFTWKNSVASIKALYDETIEA